MPRTKSAPVHVRIMAHQLAYGNWVALPFGELRVVQLKHTFTHTFVRFDADDVQWRWWRQRYKLSVTHASLQPGQPHYNNGDR